MTLRQAHRSDIAGMHRVRIAVRENRLSSPDRIGDADYRAAIENLGRGWVIEVDAVVVAFAVGYATDGNIWALFVHPDHEGRGYGRQLHDVMVQWLWAQGLARLWLTTAEGSRAEGFYAAAGWRRSGSTPSGEVGFELDRDQE